MAFRAVGDEKGSLTFSQMIFLMYYCQDIVTVLANMTKSYLYGLPTSALKLSPPFGSESNYKNTDDTRL